MADFGDLKLIQILYLVFVILGLLGFMGLIHLVFGTEEDDIDKRESETE